MSSTAQTSTQILDLARRFVIQRAELYEGEFYSEAQSQIKQVSSGGATLDEFHDQIKNCQNCRLANSRTNFVFGTGNPKAKLMCVGEAPGHDEDLAGEPFVGAAGQLLNKILAAIGFQRDEVYIANIIKCRPPGNRDPEAGEISECLPYLERQFEMIQPELILALGRVAAQTLLATGAPLGALRRTVHNYRDKAVVVTYHPAALLRNPQWKRSTWEDVKLLRSIYDEKVGDKPPLALAE